MAVLTIPSGIRIESSTFGLRSNTQVFRSPFNQATQRVAMIGAKWFANYNLTLHTRAEIASLQAFLIQLEGQANTFYGYDPDAKTPRGIASGIPKVKGTLQTGTSLITDGWTASQTGILLVGDYIEVNNELKQIIENVNSDSGGNSTLIFGPPLRHSPADNADITVNQASAIMHLTSDETPWDTDHRGLYKMSFSGVEVIGL